MLVRYRNSQPPKAKAILDALVQSYAAHNIIVDVEELGRLGILAENAEGGELGVMKDLSDPLYSLGEDRIELFPKVNPGDLKAASIGQAKKAAKPSKRMK